MSDATETISPEFISQDVARAKTYYRVLLMRGPRDLTSQTLLDEVQIIQGQSLFPVKATQPRHAGEDASAALQHRA